MQVQSMAGAEGGNSLALVVDDEPSVLLFLSDCLEDLGYRVLSADCANAALDMIREAGQLTVALIDLSLPDRSGLELMADLQQHQPGLPVIIASGYGAMALRDHDSAGRPPPILTKPYDAQAIAKQLSALGLY